MVLLRRCNICSDDNEASSSSSNGGVTMTSRSTTTAAPLANVVVDDSSINGRKGPSYDWQAVLIPSDPVFEASLQTLLGAPPVAARTRKARRRS
jgi:hypothetical protein